MSESNQSSPKQPSLAANTTVRVVTVMLGCLAVVLFFQHTPPAVRWPLRLVLIGGAGWLGVTAVRTMRKARMDGKKAIFSLILAGLFYLALHATCLVFIWLMGHRDERLTTRAFTSLSDNCRTGIRDMLSGTSYNLYDRDVGWVPRPGFQSEMYNINAQGIRGAREYPEVPPDPAKRILCMGDSFTFGFAVGDDETYPHHAELLRPGTEWINLGISGTCLTQSLLHYRKSGRRFGGKHVIIGFMTNDAQRTVNCFRPFVSPHDAGHPFTKPYARYGGGRFSIEPNPYQSIADFDRLLANEGPEIERLRKLDYLTWSEQSAATNPVLRTLTYVGESMRLDQNIDMLLDRKPAGRKVARRSASADPYGRDIWNPDSPGFQAIVRLFEVYRSEIIADGSEPLIVVIPGPLDVEDYQKGGRRQYAGLLSHFRTKDWRYLDFLDALIARHQDKLSRESLFSQLHYTGAINRELAEAIINALQLP